MKRRIIHRMLAAILAIVMLVTAVPADTYAAANLGDLFSQASYDEDLVNEMTALYEGNQDKAIAVLDTLRANGLIDENGNMILGDTFDVEGTAVTKDELKAMADAADPNSSATIDGTVITWGEIRQMFTTLDAMELVQSCENSQELLTEEHITAMESLYAHIANNGLSLTGDEDGNLGLSVTSGTVESQGTTRGKEVSIVGNQESGYVIGGSESDKAFIDSYGLDPNYVYYIPEDQVYGYATKLTSIKIDESMTGDYIKPYEIEVSSSNAYDSNYNDIPGQYEFKCTNKKGAVPYDIELKVRIIDGSYTAASISSVDGSSVSKGTKQINITIPKGKSSVKFVTAANKDTFKSWRDYWTGNYNYVVNVSTKAGESRGFACNVGGYTEAEAKGGLQFDTSEFKYTANNGLSYSFMEKNALSSNVIWESKSGLSATPVHLFYKFSDTIRGQLEEDVKYRLKYNDDMYISGGGSTGLTLYFSSDTEGYNIDGVYQNLTLGTVPSYMSPKWNLSVGSYTKEELLDGRYLVMKMKGDSPITYFRMTDAAERGLYPILPTLIEPTVTIPEGTFYPNQIIPITVDLGGPCARVNENISLTVNGQKLSPAEAVGDCARRLTFLYTVADMDALSLQVSDFQISGVDIEGTALQYDPETFAGAANENCKLSTPTKLSTLDLNAASNFDKQEDGSYRMSIPFVEEAITGDPSDSKLTWLMANTAQDDDGNYYVKSLYAETAPGERYPVYVETSDYTYYDEVTGQTITLEELPVGLYVEFTPKKNLTEYYTIFIVGLFMDHDLSSTVNYIEDLTKSATPLYGLWRSFISEPIVLFSEKSKDVTIEYGDDWKAFVPEENLAKKDYTIPGAFDNQVADGMTLSYNITPGKKYTFPEAKNFTWTSSDESIATVKTKRITFKYGGENVQKTTATIIPTGKAGTVTFSLNVGNGDKSRSYSIESAPLTIVESADPYLTIPKVGKEIITIQNEEADIFFATNCYTLNARTEGNENLKTDVTLTVYPCDSKGNITGDAVYQKKEKATVQDPITGFTIPQDILYTLSPRDGFSYVAEVAVESRQGKKPLTAQALIKVKSLPAKVQFDQLDNNYVLDNKRIFVSWDIKNINAAIDTKEWYYTITRKSDNTLLGGGSGESDKRYTFDSSDMGLTLDLSSAKYHLEDKNKAKGTAGLLKDVYNISVYASNDPEEDGYSMDSILLYVYNADAMDIIVRAVTGESVTVSDSGNHINMDNTEYVEGLKKSGSPALDLDKVTLQELREDVNLSTLVSMNYDEYTWGLLSDQIAWEIEQEGESDAELNYKQAGIYANIKASLLPSYLPTSNLLLTATEDGSFSVKATHVNTGQVQTITGEAKNLKDQLYLFQMNPAVKTTLRYTNGENKVITIDTDEKGAIALYEPSGIKSNVTFRAESDGDTYLSSRYNTDLLSSERNVALLQAYPVNNVKLYKVSEATIYLKKPDGTPLANTDVTVRGGVYWNWEYAKNADLLKVKNGYDELDVPYSNGLHDQIFTTDKTGALRVYFDVAQMVPEGYQFVENDRISYAFELRTVKNGADVYEPEVFELYSGARSAGGRNASVNITLSNISGNNGKYTIFRNKMIDHYEGKEIAFQTDLTYEGSVDSVGASQKYQKIIFRTLTYLWDYELETDPQTHQAKLGKTSTSMSALLQTKDTKKVLNGQSEAVIAYPFSTFPILQNTYTMTGETYGGVLNKEGKYDWSKAWLKANEEVPVEIALRIDGVQTRTIPIEFNVVNTLGEYEPVESPQMSHQAIETVTESLDFDVDKLLGNLVPGGDMLAKGMSFFSGIATGGDYTIGTYVLPTNDPLIYNLVLSVGEYEADDGDINLDYSDATNAEELQELFGDADDAEEEEDDDNDVSFTFRGSLIARATYNLAKNDWNIEIIGGDVGAKVKIEKKYKENFMISIVPVTVEFGANAYLDVGFGGRETGALTSIAVGAGIEAFAGIGFDISIIALKFGIYGSLGMEFSQKILTYTGGVKQGQALSINGEVGLKFVAKILFLKYEKIFASVGFGWSKSWNSYDFIEDYWEGTTSNGMTYTATAFEDGQTMFTIESNGIEDREYLNKYTRVWVEDAAKEAAGSEGTFHVLQTNAYPYSDPIFSDDGRILIYLSDAGSENAEDTVACWAAWDEAAGAFVEKGAIARTENDTPATYGYGDSNLSISGSNGHYVAAWVQTSETFNLTADDENTVNDTPAAETEETSPEDLSRIMKSAEIRVAILDQTNGKETWESERLTDNNLSDLAPMAASDTNGNAVIFWRSTYSSGDTNPLDFNVEDKVLYSRYNGTAWSEPAIAYNGSSGAVNGLGAAMADNGSCVAAYTVKTGEAEDSSDFETFYSFIKADGSIETARVTQNNIPDENIQVVSAKNGSDEVFLLGWYTGDENGDTDIKLLCIKDNGAFDTTFPESMNMMGEVKAGPTFRFALPKDGKISDLAIAWTERVTRVTEGGEPEEYTIDTLQAVKLYEYGGNYGVTGSQLMAEAEVNQSIDYFDVYASGNTVYAVSNIMDYSNLDFESVAQIDLNDLVEAAIGKKSNYSGTEEQYEAAWNQKYQELVQRYNSPYMDIYVQSGEALMAQAAYTFKEGLELLDVTYDGDGVFKGSNLAVSYMVKNVGISPLHELKILDSTDGSTITSDSDTVLQPGEIGTITAFYPIEDVTKNIEYQVKAGSQAVSGEVILNLPDIGVSSVEIAEANEGFRKINVGLNNNSEIPLKGNNKTIVLGLYLDAECSVPLLKDSQPVQAVIEPSEDEEAQLNLGLIDDWAYVTQLEVDVRDILQTLYEGRETEIPEDGFPLYAKANLYDNYGTESPILVEEHKKHNNQKSVTIQNLSEKAGGEELSFLNTDMEQTEDGFKVSMDIFNNKLGDQTVGNVVVELLDEGGNILAAKQTYDPDHAGADLIITGENTESITLTFGTDELDDPDNVISVNAYVCTKQAKVSFHMGGRGKEPAAQTVELGAKAVKPSTPADSGEYRFGGWYTDSAYTHEFDFANTEIVKNTMIYAKWNNFVPHLTEQPKALKTTYDGKEKTLSVVAECEEAAVFTYQWYKNNKVIAGADTSEYTVMRVADSGAYHCVITAEVSGKTYTLKSDTASVDMKARKLTLTAASESKRWDGTELTKDGYTITAGSLGYNDNLEVDVTGSITKKGEADNIITSAKVLRDDIDVTADYELTLVTGTLRITETMQEEHVPLITAQPVDISVTYDDQPHVLSAAAECDYDMIYQWYKDGKKIADATDPAYNVRTVADSGSYTCKITANIEGEEVMKDSRTAKVSIKKAVISITADSAAKEHDGKELKKESYTYAGTLAAGHKLNVTINSSLTKPGTTANKISEVTVKNGSEDTSANYELKTVNGKLTVTKGKSYQVSYDKNNKAAVTGVKEDVNRYQYGKKAKVLDALSWKNQFFTGWNTKKDGSGKNYLAGAKMPVTTNVTLYAQWEKKYTAKDGLTYQVNSVNKTVTVTGCTKKNAASIKIPDTIKYQGIKYKVTIVDKKAFQGMSKLKTVKIGNNVTKIGDKAFYDCAKLNNVTLGKSVTTLGKNVFTSGSSSMTITLKGTGIKNPNVLAVKGKTVTLKVPRGIRSEYQEKLEGTGVKVK